MRCALFIHVRSTYRRPLTMPLCLQWSYYTAHNYSHYNYNYGYKISTSFGHTIGTVRTRTYNTAAHGTSRNASSLNVCLHEFLFQDTPPNGLMWEKCLQVSTRWEAGTFQRCSTILASSLKEENIVDSTILGTLLELLYSLSLMAVYSSTIGSCQTMCWNSSMHLDKDSTNCD